MTATPDGLKAGIEASLRAHGYIPLQEAEERHKLTHGAIQNWIRQGKVVSMRVGRFTFVKADQVAACTEGFAERQAAARALKAGDASLMQKLYPGALTKAPSHTPRATPGALVVRKGGEQLRRFTIYLPVELAQKLGAAATAAQMDMNTIVRDAVRTYLIPAPAKPAEAERVAIEQAVEAAIKRLLG